MLKHVRISHIEVLFTLLDKKDNTCQKLTYLMLIKTKINLSKKLKNIMENCFLVK